VLLDLFMPELDGWGFYERFRERPDLSNVPVIVHSSATDRAPQGVTRVLRKPVGFETLLSVVHEFCLG
jgi:CheY-like chemotaxis protein